MWNVGLDESQTGICEEDLKSLLMRVKEESAKVGFKLNIKKTKIMASGPITSWQIDEKEMKVSSSLSEKLFVSMFSPLYYFPLMISVQIQGKPFNITIVQVYAPATGAEEAEVDWFYEGLQHLLELTPKNDVLIIMGDWNAKCKEIEENNRIGRTRDLFKNIEDMKGMFQAKIGMLKDQNGRDLTEAEEIKKRWQDYTEELYKKELNIPDNHDGVVTDLEPDILECEVKWALGGLSNNKASGGDSIPAELFKILKDDAVKVLHSICQQINLYAEHIMRKAGLDESPVGIKIAGRKLNNLRYADDTTLMAESEEELKGLLMRVKEERAKVGLKLNIMKTKIMASGPITSWQIDGKEMEVETDFIFLDSKITADGDCSQEIKRHLLLGRKTMANLDSILKNRDITLPTNVSIVKAMVFPVAMYGCESWTIRKAEHRRIEAFELWCWRRLLRVPWTARRSNRSVLEEINPDCSLEDQILNMKLKYFGHPMRRKGSLEKSLMLGAIDGKRRGWQRMRWLDGVTEAVGVSFSGLRQMVEDRKALRNAQEFYEKFRRSFEEEESDIQKEGGKGAEAMEVTTYHSEEGQIANTDLQEDEQTSEPKEKRKSSSVKAKHKHRSWSRIDMIWITPDLVPDLLEAEIETNAWADHNPVTMTLKGIVKTPRWVLNKALLKDKKIKEEINKEMELFFQINKIEETCLQNACDTAKVYVRGLIIPYSAKINEMRKQEQSKLAEKLTKLEQELQEDPSKKDLKIQMNILKHKLNLLDTNELTKQMKLTKQIFFKNANKPGRWLAYKEGEKRLIYKLKDGEK
ncbi:Craniofacial development protein 2 [Varanus komodoensis]|nr:Craniofacial development protein 2 [Varanus komodoensis]